MTINMNTKSGIVKLAESALDKKTYETLLSYCKKAGLILPFASPIADTVQLVLEIFGKYNIPEIPGATFLKEMVSPLVSSHQHLLILKTGRNLGR